MSISVGDTVRITEAARDALADRGIEDQIGAEVRVHATLEGLVNGVEDRPENFNPLAIVFAPEGAIWAEVGNPNDPEGVMGLAPGEFEQVAA